MASLKEASVGIPNGSVVSKEANDFIYAPIDTLTSKVSKKLRLLSAQHNSTSPIHISPAEIQKFDLFSAVEKGTGEIAVVMLYMEGYYSPAKKANENSREIYVPAILVDEKYANQGICKNMLAAFIEDYGHGSMKSLIIRTWGENEEVRTAARANGLLVSKRYPDKFGRKNDLLYYRRSLIPYERKTSTLCWKCQRATANPKKCCSWFKDFSPVEGWTASFSEMTGGYCVKECPKFIEEEFRVAG